MIKPRKYQNVYVSSDIYVDSQCDYHFHVFYDDTTKKKRIEDEYITGIGLIESNVKYLDKAAEVAILEVLKSGKATFYEYDRDGNKRRDNYRYYDETILELYRESIEKRVNNGK